MIRSSKPTLREYLEQMIADTRDAGERNYKGLRELIDQRNTAQEEAIRIANESLAGRLELMNNFRMQLETERGTYVRRELLDEILGARDQRQETRANTVDAAIERLEEEQRKGFASITTRNDRQDGRFAAVVFGLPILFFAISVALHFIS